MQLLVKKLSEEAILPQKAYDSDAGFDLFSRTHITLKPQERYLLNTDLAVQIPNGFCGVIKDRSGNSVKKGMHVLAGIVDSGYIGPLKVCIINLSNQPVTIDIGDKIAQMLIVPVPQIEVVQVNELQKTDRGSAGFGSTGM